MSARCSGSVGGSSTGPTGPVASADRSPSRVSWVHLRQLLPAQGSPPGLPRRVRQASAAASRVTRGAGSASRKPLMPSARAAESHCSMSLRDQSAGAGVLCWWGCWGQLPAPVPFETPPHLCMGLAAQACRGIHCLALRWGREGGGRSPTAVKCCLDPTWGLGWLLNVPEIKAGGGGGRWQRTQHIQWQVQCPQFHLPLGISPCPVQHQGSGHLGSAFSQAE